MALLLEVRVEEGRVAGVYVGGKGRERFNEERGQMGVSMVMLVV